MGSNKVGLQCVDQWWVFKLVPLWNIIQQSKGIGWGCSLVQGSWLSPMVGGRKGETGEERGGEGRGGKGRGEERRGEERGERIT
jgi:hypothetical protein